MASNARPGAARANRTDLTNPKRRMDDISIEEGAQESSNAWDVYDETALDFDDSIEDKTVFSKLVKLLKAIVYLSTFLLVLCFGIISKTTLLFMTSAIRKSRSFSNCFNVTGHERDILYEIRISKEEQFSWMWCLLFALFIPEILTFIRSSRLCIFKKYEKPKVSSFILVLIIESLHVVGLVMLVFSVFPDLTVSHALALSNAVCILPSLFNFYTICNTKCSIRTASKYILYLTAFSFQVVILGLIISFSYKDIKSVPKTPEIYGVISVIFISFSWWENFVNQDFPRLLTQAKEDISKSRHFIYIFISLWKMALILGLTVLFLQEGILDFFKLHEVFQHHNLTRVWPTDHNLTYNIKQGEDTLMNVGSNHILQIVVTVAHIVASYMCYSCCKFACKVCIQKFSFSLPLCCTIPATMMLLGYVCSHPTCAYSEQSPYIFWMCPKGNSDYFLSPEFGIIWILWIIIQMVTTVYIWFPHCERMASTNKLFVNPMYCTVLLDQSLVLNRRKYEKELVKKKESVFDASPEAPSEDVPRIFACATMWHETLDEMEQLLKSIMRMDAHQCSQEIIQLGLVIRNPDYYELQVHIFFDDAFVLSDKAHGKRTVNNFVKDFVLAVDTAASKVYKKCLTPDPPTKIPTPYGGQLLWELPGGTFLIVHLKDKERIRHKKRWSQVMYMYYLLGYGLEYKIPQRVGHNISMDKLRKNTFLLALDGDIDFKPSAVQHLVDLMKRNPNLGAACGRIHPVGTGLMVYYQKFEYAIGHWLQKSTEHMIGCVLCSPGCFSLFRAEALLKNNTIRTYSTKAKEAIEFVQFDQGEDRWLCTLLLQRGYRVEYSAASDAYTHCPETFAEFYTQRRRWAPSTMANIMDLLINYRKTVECNDNISRPYIAYQVLLMIGTILGPGTIFLMLVGAMVTALGISNWQALAANTVPVVFFILICFLTKNDTQIFVAQIFSALYALLMMAVLVGISLQLVIDGITSPSGIFILSMTASFVIAALAHPQEFWCVAHGILYFLSVPSMYLLLALYSFINLHVVSWGTREVQAIIPKKQMEEQLRAQAALQPKDKGGMFDWINSLGYKGNIPEEEGSISFSFANLFRCMCCTYPKPDPTSLQLAEIERTLKNITNQMNARSGRRRSSLHIRRDDLNLGLHSVPEEDSEEGDDSLDEGQSEIAQREDNEEYWLSDPDLPNSSVKRITNQEKEFWQDLIKKYLYPLPDDPEEKAKVSRQLKELRNNVVFGVLMLNSLFILIVFLLQMKKDVLHVEWPLSGKNKNITYIRRLEEIRIDMEYLQLEPINLILVFFFTLILVIQFVAMLFHRSETLSHILASTNLFEPKGKEEINFNKLTDLLRKGSLVEVEESETTESVNDEVPAPEVRYLQPRTNSAIDCHIDGVPRIFSPRPSMSENIPERKFRSLSLVMEEDLLKIVDKNPKLAQVIKRKSRNPDALEALRIKARLKKQGINTPICSTRSPTPCSTMRDLERLDYNWSNPGSFRRSNFIRSVVTDTSDSESVAGIQMTNLSSSPVSFQTSNVFPPVSNVVVTDSDSSQPNPSLSYS